MFYVQNKNKEKEKFTLIQKDLHEFDNKELTLYTYIKMHQGANDSTETTLKSAYSSCVGWSNSRGAENARTALKGLAEKGLIEVYTNFLMTDKADIKKLKPTESIFLQVNEMEIEIDGIKSFTMMFKEEYLKIITSDIKGVKKENLFKIAVVVISYINAGGDELPICYPSIKRLQKDTKLSNKTLIKSIDVLEKLEILSKETLTLADGQQKSIYSRFEDAPVVSYAVGKAVASNTLKVDKTIPKNIHSIMGINPPQKKTEIKSLKNDAEIVSEVYIEWSNRGLELNNNANKKLDTWVKKYGDEVVVRAIRWIASDCAETNFYDAGTGYYLNKMEGMIRKVLEYDRQQDKIIERLNKVDVVTGHPFANLFYNS